MTRIAGLLAACLAAAALAGCATTQRLAAAGDVHALLVSIRDDDREAFEAHIDRPALERQIEARLQAEAESADVGATWKSVGAMLAGPLSRMAGEAFLRPAVFRAVAEQYGYGADRPLPNTLQVASILRSLPDGRVCAPRKKNGPCLLTFAEEDGTWRLVSFEGDTRLLRRRGG